MVTSGHDVGQRQQGLEHPFTVVAWLARNLDQGPLTMLETNIFGLNAVAEIVTVTQAGTVKAGPAGGTVAATVGEWGNYEVTRLDRGDV